MAKVRKVEATKRTTKPSSQRDPADDFIATARRLECDEDKGRFEEKLGKIAAVKPRDGGK